MPERKLLDQVSDLARLRHLSLRTEDTYRAWIKRFIFFHGRRHPRDLDAGAVRAFLTYLAVEEHVSALRAQVQPAEQATGMLAAAEASAGAGDYVR